VAEYPEHDRLLAVKTESQALGEFLEWLQAVDGGDIILAERGPYDGPNDQLFMKHVDVNALLANYFGIDLAIIEEEKRAMLERQRELNTHNTPLQRAHQRGLDQEGTE
jgi:hypothetical protein